MHPPNPLPLQTLLTLVITLLQLTNAHPTPAPKNPSTPDNFIPPLPLLYQSLSTTNINPPKPFERPPPKMNRLHDTFNGESDNDGSYSGMQKRANGGVRICSEEGFEGYCWYGVFALNTCIGLGSL